MSTRAYIRIKKKGEGEVHFHHHCDGYPDGVGSDLVDILTQYTGDWSPAKLGAFINEKDKQFKFIDNGPSWDHEYLYLIDCDERELSCYYKGITSVSEYQEDYFCADKLFIRDNIFDGRKTESTPSTISVDWQSFRREAAKVAMQGMLASGDNGWSLTLADGYKPGEKHSYPIGIARFAIACADELIRQLKEDNG